MNKPQAPNIETERQLAADQALRAHCDLIITRAAELMVEQGAPIEMIIDRMTTYATGQCMASFGKEDALKLHRQGLRAVKQGVLDHLLPKTVN